MMSTTRLKGIYKQEQNHRKVLCVMNDLAKTQQDMYEGLLNKEKKEAVQKCDKSIVMTRRNVVRQNVLRKCMKTTREKVENSPAAEKFGRYNGIGVEQIAEDIDTYLKQDHPRIRRQLHVNQLFENGYKKGTILDNETAKQKVQHYFDRPLVQVHTGAVVEQRKASRRARPDRATYLPPLATGFYTADVDCNWNKPKTGERENTCSDERNKMAYKFITDEFPDDLSVHSDEASLTQGVASDSAEATPRTKPASKLRPLTLPPIKLGTDNNTLNGKPKSNCVAELISRLNRAKDRRDRESKVRKERRAKRLQAERVHGYPQAFNDFSVEEVAGHSLIVEGYSQSPEANEGSKGQPEPYVTNRSSKQETQRKLPPLKFKSSAVQKFL